VGPGTGGDLSPRGRENGRALPLAARAARHPPRVWRGPVLRARGIAARPRGFAARRRARSRPHDAADRRARARARRAVPRAAEARRRERAPAGRQGADRRGGSRRRAGARDRGKPSAPLADPAPLRAFRRDDPPGLRRHEPRYAASDCAARHGHLVPARALRALRDPRARRPLRDPGRRRGRAARARPRMAARAALASALPPARDADAADDPGDARGRDPARLTSPNVPLLLRSCRRPKESAPEVSTMSQRFPIAAFALAALAACTQEPATSPSVEPDAGSAEPAADTAEPAAP